MDKEKTKVELEEQNQEQAQDTTVDQGPDIAAIATQLKEKYPNIPDPDVFEQWKESFGKIFIVPLSDDEIYVFRRLTRLEWKTIQKEMQQVSQAGVNVDSMWIEERVVKQALLYPSWDINFKNVSAAGTISTLYKQITLVSNFLDDQTAMQLIVEI